MRTGTIVFWLLFILLFAFFGWRVFGFLLVFALVLVALAVGAVLVALWTIRRRMTRNLEELTARLGGRTEGPRPRRQAEDVIDVEATVRRPRDGADAPEDHDRPPE